VPSKLEDKNMHILFAGGGTAGHINPALAIAGHIKNRHPDAVISFIGTSEKLEARLVPEAGYNFYTIDVAGFQRKISVENIKKNISAVIKAFTSSRDAKKLLLKLKPDVVVGTGGYVSGPVLREAAKLGIKTAIHEQNAYPGITTKMLAPKADAVMLAMPEAEKYLKLNKKPIITGNPIRETFLSVNREFARAALGIDERPFILSYGGSLGADIINKTAAEVIAWHWKDARYYHYHGTGRSGYESTINLLTEKGVDLKKAKHLRVTEYINDMGLCMAAADLVICRAGAITLSELEILGKAAILIPSPYVAENHQFHNAMTLKEKGAAEVIEEIDLTGETLINKVSELIGNRQKLKIMGEKAKACAIFDVNERIYSVVMGLYKSKSE